MKLTETQLFDLEQAAHDGQIPEPWADQVRAMIAEYRELDNHYCDDWCSGTCERSCTLATKVEILEERLKGKTAST